MQAVNAQTQMYFIWSETRCPGAINHSAGSHQGVSVTILQWYMYTNPLKSLFDLETNS